MTHTAHPPWPRWLLIGLLLAVCLLLFARKITQLALPGLDVRPENVFCKAKLLSSNRSVPRRSRRR